MDIKRHDQIRGIIGLDTKIPLVTHKAALHQSDNAATTPPLRPLCKPPNPFSPGIQRPSGVGYKSQLSTVVYAEAPDYPGLAPRRRSIPPS